MKFVLPKLRLGQTIQAKVTDQNRDGSLIVDFGGDLLRVINQAGAKFKVGQQVQLEVRALNPLQFRIQQNTDFRDAHIDRNA